jgi:dipeptidase D
MNLNMNMDYVTAGLKPKEVLEYFEQLSQIPRGSYNEKQVSDFLKAFGEKLNLETIQDDVMNIIIKKSGTKGYENAPTVILQGHMDMVCEKNEGTIHDFEKDPLKLYVEGDLLKAEGTTLGADNGIAVAYAMAILASDDIAHPPLEVIITVEEETGMGGVIGFDKKNVSGKRLINIDSEEEGVFFASCAGGARANIILNIEKEEIKTIKSYKIQLKGLKGGHSGLNIKDGRGNAIKLLGRLLNNLRVDYQLVEVKGGSKPNAIPREAEIVVTTSDEKALMDNILEIERKFNKELEQTDHLSLTCEEGKEVTWVYTEALKRKITDLLVLIPCGIQTMSFAIDGLVESSLSIGVLTEKEDKLIFESAIRSSVKSLKHEMINRLETLSALVDGSLEILSDYPEWAYNPDSILQDLFLKVYKDTTGKEGKIHAIHAGLECGFFAEKLTDTGDGSDLDMISLGPDMAHVHTPYEQLSLSSVERTWVFLKNILASIK